MQTSLKPDLLKTARGQRIDDILRKCVHCGFCLATCPTYQLTGDELDSPRGRIYQIKQVFEGQAADNNTQLHLDRCLTCRSCETTCPSGVNYAELLDYGREEVNSIIKRPALQQGTIRLLNSFLPYPKRHSFSFKALSFLKPLIPNILGQKIPSIRPAKKYPVTQRQNFQNVFLLEGCVQSTISPNTNQAAVAVLSSMGYQVIKEKSPKCCGALSHHSGNEKNTLAFIKKQLEQWQKVDDKTPLSAIISTASGCGVMLKDYERLLPKHDQKTYQNLLDKIVDISELLDIGHLKPQLKTKQSSIAFHAPCTLNHGQQLAARLKENLTALGYQLKEPKNAHICCGSAGTYSIMQANLSTQLKNNKVKALEETNCELIITANVGCEHHLASTCKVNVRHWIELIADDLIPS